MPIVLASASPRRRELLEKAGYVFEVVVSPVEELHDASIPPERLCEMNAELKAGDVAARRPDATVVGADTLVFIDGEPLGKPQDLDEARCMLRRLAGRVHQVCTGVCVIFPKGRREVFHETTLVRFRPLAEADIETYVQLAHTLDKAGAYGIQEHGERIVESIQGDYDNVVGLPVKRLTGLLGP
jgi:septum formation protein